MAEETAVAKTERKITIDGVEYTADQLSKAALQQLANVRATDQEITRLEQQLAIHRTARATYASALSAELKKTPEAPEATH